MLKEVGASGQISLGKKYAGQLFEVQIAEDNSITLRPVKVVPVTHSVQEALATYGNPASQALAKQNQAWAQTHAEDIAAYNAWAVQTEPYAQRVRRWREEFAQATEPTHGTV